VGQPASDKKKLRHKEKGKKKKLLVIHVKPHYSDQEVKGGKDFGGGNLLRLPDNAKRKRKEGGGWKKTIRKGTR